MVLKLLPAVIFSQSFVTGSSMSKVFQRRKIFFYSHLISELYFHSFKCFVRTTFSHVLIQHVYLTTEVIPSRGTANISLRTHLKLHYPQFRPGTRLYPLFHEITSRILRSDMGLFPTPKNRNQFSSFTSGKFEWNKLNPALRYHI